MKRVDDALEKHITVAPHAVAIAAGLIAWCVAPTVDASHDPASLSSFFSASAQVLATLLVALALFQGAGGLVKGHAARRFISMAAFAYLGLALSASLAALSPLLPDWMYAWMFVVVIGGGVSALATTLLVGAANIRSQNQAAIVEHATELGKPKTRGTP